ERVERALPVGEGPARVRGAPVPARVRDDQAVPPRQIVEVEHVDPVAAGAGEAVEQDQRLAVAADLVVHVDAVKVCVHGPQAVATAFSLPAAACADKLRFGTAALAAAIFLAGAAGTNIRDPPGWRQARPWPESEVGCRCGRCSAGRGSRGWSRAAAATRPASP